MKNLIRKGFQYIQRKISGGIECLRYYLIYPWARWRYKNRAIYLVAERGTDARDNGYHFFKYIREHYPEKEAYYVIDKNSTDYEKVAALGNTIQFGSLKHYLLFIGSKYKISTHIMGYSPKMLYYISFNQKHRVPGKQIFLQHGIIQNNLVGLYQERTLADVFICGAYPEYKYVSENFHYRNGEVKYTGLARFDNLQNNETKNQILLMPTWRQYLKTMSDAERASSIYFIYWNRVLHDQRIIDKLKEHNMQLVFYPHYEMQQYISAFTSDVEEVIIADFAHYDVQTLLKESKLMVTDFSSVFFDFAYMKKPVVYFQFDRAMFFSTHYQKGYFDYDSMGFGEVAIEYEELIELLINYIDQDCKLKTVYQERIQLFFPLHDGNNCKRIMEVID